MAIKEDGAAALSSFWRKDGIDMPHSQTSAEISSASKDSSIIDQDQIEGLLAAAGAEGVRDILSAFWRSTEGLFAALVDQLTTADFGGAARSAHALKGSALNVGANKLADGARRIEDASKDRNSASALMQLAAARKDYEDTIDAFERRIGAPLRG